MKTDVINGNKLIAEFMKTQSSIVNDMYFGNDGVLYTIENLRYHFSWDWLKPVIDRILKEMPIKTVDECTEEEWHYMKSITGMYIGVDVQIAWNYVVEYLLYLKRKQTRVQTFINLIKNKHMKTYKVTYNYSNGDAGIVGEFDNLQDAIRCFDQTDFNEATYDCDEIEIKKFVGDNELEEFTLEELPIGYEQYQGWFIKRR